MSYSQSTEEKEIINYFGDFTGTLLDLGANNGEMLSNSRALIKNGFCGTLVEPSPAAFDQLQILYQFNETICCLNVAVADYCGVMPFYHSGNHLNKGDVSLLSTLKESETKRWAGTTDFEEIEVEVVDFAALLEASPYKQFDMISIDCEGYDLEILGQMDLNKLGCKLICIEWNSNPENFFHMNNYIIPFGFRLLHTNPENLIYAR